MFLQLLRLFLHIVCFTASIGHDLAVVRPFASQSEVASLESSFLSWEQYLPCNETPHVPVDLILVFSQAFEDNPGAWSAASAVHESFQNGTQSWHRCFRSVIVTAANLTAAEDIYDSRGYAVRKDWVNGPNKVFRFILRSFVEGDYAVNYTAFYFMEIDAVPVRSYWLDQYLREALCYPSAAIRGSRYLGDSWDTFSNLMPEDLLVHINGNAIYYVEHPWLRWLNSRLIEEAATEHNEIAFDVRMARLTLDGRLGEAWNQSVSDGEEPYQDDSQLVGNFGNTLLNSSFEYGVYIKHGSLSNIFENLDNLTLTVAAYNQSQRFEDSTSLQHPFRTILMLHFDEFNESNGTIQTSRGPTTVQRFRASRPDYFALCELASMVETEYFVFTDSYHFIASPVDVLATSSGNPVLPYISATSVACTSRAGCTSSLSQAEDLFGVKLNYHHDTFETVFITNLTQQFCHNWELATSQLNSFESCGFVHGPTADDYLAWQISMNEPLRYVPKEKERVGWRQWTLPHEARDVDQRNCSVYTQTEKDLQLQGIAACGLIVEDDTTCLATSGCFWRPIFSSGRCIASPKITFPWQRNAEERPVTCTEIQSTTTSSTTTRSNTMTSQTNTDTSTSGSITTTTETISTTSVTGTVSQTTQTATTTSRSMTATSTTYTGSSVTTTATTVTSTSSSATASTSLTTGTTTGTVTSMTATSTTATSTISTSLTTHTTSITATATVTSATTSQTTQTLTTTSRSMTATSTTYTGSSVTTTATTVTSTSSSATASTSLTTGTTTGTVTSMTATSTTVSSTSSRTRTETTQTVTSTSRSNTITSTTYTGSTMTTSATIVTTSYTSTTASTTLTTLTTTYTATSITATTTVSTTSLTTSHTTHTVTATSHTTTATFTSATSTMSTSSATKTTTETASTTTGTVTATTSATTQTATSTTSTITTTSRTTSTTTLTTFTTSLTSSRTSTSITQTSNTLTSTSKTSSITGTKSTTLTTATTTSQTTTTVTTTATSLTSTSHTTTRTSTSATTSSTTSQTSVTGTSTSYTTTSSSTSTSSTSNTATKSTTITTGTVTTTRSTLTVSSTSTGTSTISSTSSATGTSSTETSHTVTTTSSTMSSTTSVSSVTITETGTSTSITTATQTTTATSLTATSSTVSSITVTSTTGTTTLLPGSCPEPSILGADTSACVGLFPGATCQVSCAAGFIGDQTSIYTCTPQEIFSGTGPSCVQTTTLTTVTTTRTELVACSGGLPTTLGTDINDCFGKLNGQSCTVSCMATFEGQAAEYVCNPTTQQFEGPGVSCTKIACKDNELPSGFDTSACANLVAGDFCLVSCQAGFVPAAEKYTCGVDGSFSGTPPTCERVVCPADSLPVAPGVNVTACVGTVTGQSCDVTCAFGFEGTASSYSCGLDGAFTGTVPSCARKTCAIPSDFSSSALSHDCNGILHGARCTVSCAAGYYGTPKEQECSDGSLVADLPSCTAITCTFAGMSIPAAIDVSSCVGVVSGQSCNVQCQRGYKVVGDVAVQCLTTGSFSAIAATCEPEPCGNLTDVSPFSGTAIGESCAGVVTGQVCTAFCQPGYTISGNATVLVCGQGPDTSQGYTEFVPNTENSWPAEQSSGPDCRINTCSQGVPDNPMLSHNCSSVQTGGKCLVSAVAPYQLTGVTSVELTCEASGHLTGTNPAIIPGVCPDGSFGTGSGSTCQQIEFGGDCWAYCQTASGYEGLARQYRCELTGDVLELKSVVADLTCATVTVTLTTTVIGRRLASLDPCSSTSVTQVGLGDQQFLHDCTDKAHDEACIAHCGFGYDMVETAPAVFVCKDSALEGASLPTCLGKTCNYSLPSGLGVSHNCDSKSTGQTCEASCGQAGYTYASNSNQQQFTCMGSGIFQGTTPSCEAILCTDLELSNRFFHNCKGKRYGETCGVSCATGYHLSGWGSQLACSADGTYAGEIPNCVGNPCANPLTADLMLDSEQCNALTTGQSCTVACKSGFSANSSTMTCDGTGFLLGTAPQCNPLTCEVTSTLSDASIAHTCNEVSFNRTCAVTCAAGYKLTSGTAQEWSCNWNPSSSFVSLSGSLPSCEAEVCTTGLPKESDRTITNCTNLKTGETCQQQCASGYVGSDAAFTCSSDGAARTASSGQCEPVTCNLTISDSSIGHLCTDVSFAYRCSSFCNKGYTASNGVQTLTCSGPDSGISPAQNDADNASITLRGTLPICVAQACFFNFPTGSQFVHNCDGIRTGESCTTSCIDAWDGEPTSLTCGANGGLIGSFPVCTLRTITQTGTNTQTTTTVTDFEMRVYVSGTLRLSVNNSEQFIQDADVKLVLGEVIAGLIGISANQLDVSIVPFDESARMLAEGDVRVVYSTWFLSDTQEKADALGNNITSQLDAAGVVILKQLLVDAIVAISSDKAILYSIEVLSHNADILVGTRKQETVAKYSSAICNPSNFPVITGAGPFNCEEPQVLGQSCRAPCESGVDAVITCEEQGWQLQDECPAESYLLVIIFGSAGALCCLIIVCVVLCACRPVKTAPIVAVDEPSVPQPLPSIREIPQPESMDTGYYSWKERWDQSRQNQGTDIPLVAPAWLTNAVPDEDRSPAAPMPPERPRPVEAERGAALTPPPLPSFARREESSPRGDDQLVKIEEPEQIIITRPDDLRKMARQEEDTRMEDLMAVEEPMTVVVQRMNGSSLAKIKSTSKQTVAEFITSIKEVAGPGVHLTLTCSTKVLRPDQTLEDAGLYDGSIVTAIRQPELFVGAAFEDGSAAVWSVESGKLERNFECRYGSVKSVTFAQSGLILVLGMVDGTVQLWNVVTGKFMRQFSGHMGAIFSVASSPNGKLLATGCFDGTSKLLNTETGRVIRVCSGHRGSIKSLCFSTDSRTLATGSEDCNVKLWKVLDRTGELTLTGHSSTITAIAFSHYGKALASGADNGEVNAWSAVSGRLVWELPRASAGVKSLAFSRDGVSLAVGAFNGECALFSATTRACTSRVQCHSTSPFQSMGFSPAGHLLITGNEAGEMQVYGTDDGASRKTLEDFAAPSMSSSVAAVAVCAGPVPKKPKGSRRRNDMATDSEAQPEE